ncbi:hypothetical protein GCM10009702_01210 [Propioniferax innocua]
MSDTCWRFRVVHAHHPKGFELVCEPGVADGLLNPNRVPLGDSSPDPSAGLSSCPADVHGLREPECLTAGTPERPNA